MKCLNRGIYTCGKVVRNLRRMLVNRASLKTPVVFRMYFE